jgi:benzil reductase ((S)-benzoin forming)
MQKPIYITGVSSGLGYGLAKVCLEQGATVYGCSRREPKDLVDQGLRFQAIDLADADAGEGLLNGQIQDVSRFDVIILNAARLGEIRDMQDTPLADLRETMEMNLWANKWVLDAMFSQGRAVQQVVAISSGASQSGSRGWNGYSLSKAALNMLIKLYAGERLETHFTSLAPGLIDTPMQDYLTQLPEDDRFPPLKVLKAAKGTEAMPDGETCARKLVELLPGLLRLESGSYADIRRL